MKEGSGFFRSVRRYSALLFFLSSISWWLLYSEAIENGYFLGKVKAFAIVVPILLLASMVEKIFNVMCKKDNVK